MYREQIKAPSPKMCIRDRRDNVLEFGELKDLVHEYNPTVRSNRSTYKDQKGKDLNAAYDDYMDDIDAIWNNADTETALCRPIRTSPSSTEVGAWPWPR